MSGNRCTIDSRVAGHYISTGGFSGADLMRERLAFRMTQKAHDLSVLKHRSYPTPNEPETEVTEKPVKKSKRRQVESDNE